MSSAGFFRKAGPDADTWPPSPSARRGGAHPVATAGWSAGLSFVALLLTAAREAWGADPDLATFDDAAISYKGFEHGSFELVTKEAVPRHIIVDDPGQTVVLSKTGSSVSFAQLANNASRMDDLQAQQQDVLANYSREHGPSGSSTPPGETVDPAAQPIDFEAPDGPTLLPAPAAVVIPASFVPDAPLIRQPPTLSLGAGVVEIDTVVFDQFTASTGSFSATSVGSGAALTFGIAGAGADPVVIAGTSYDIEKVGAFGTLHVNSASGAYVYVPNNDAINALKAPSTDSFTITASDGQASASQVFTIDINGTDDASDISGATTGSLAAVPTTAATTTVAAATSAALDASAAPSAHGILTDTDVDDPANTFAAVTAPHVSEHGYGSFTMTVDGHWTYTLDPANAAVLALTSCQTLTDTFTVTTIGGTPQTVSVVIQGADDPSVIAGDVAGSVTEAGGVHNSEHGVPVACGTLTSTDVDGPSDTFQAVKCPETSDHGYGTYTMTADGHWSFALDNANCAVEALNVGQTLTDTFTAKALDGTAQTVTVTIEGSNDAAAICGDTHGCVVEPRDPCGPPPSASGTLTDRDVDDADDAFSATSCPQASEHGYGTFVMTACGVWTYTLDPSDPAVEALRSCDTLTDCFTVTTIDGTPQTVTVTIQGSDEAHRQSFHFREDAGIAAAPAAFTVPMDSVSPVEASRPTDAFHFAVHDDGGAGHGDAGRFDVAHVGLQVPTVHHDLIL